MRCMEKRQTTPRMEEGHLIGKLALGKCTLYAGHLTIRLYNYELRRAHNRAIRTIFDERAP